MNAVWTIRFNRLVFWLRLGPYWQWRKRRYTRRELLATPGVDRLVRTVMDQRYGKYGWRVRDGVLEAEVQTLGASNSWWGPIGALKDYNTRKWLMAQYVREPKPPGEVSHAKHAEAPYKIEPPTERQYYAQHYADTEPLDDDGRTSK